MRQEKLGFTLVEVLATLAIVGVLLALLLPAVSAAREAARNTQCRSNLRHLGLAFAGYIAVHGTLPSAAYATGLFPNEPLSTDCIFSPLCAILPYLEHSALYDQINFQVNVIGMVNATVADTAVHAYLCPTDFASPIPDGYSGSSAVLVLGHNSYRCNMGPSVGLGPMLNDARAGAFAISGWTRPASFTRGLSKTVWMAEKLRGDGDYRVFRHARHWRVNPSPNGRGIVPTDQFVSLCARGSPPDYPHYPTYGMSWFTAGFISTWYNHSVEPNSDVPDCVLGDGGELPGLGFTQPGVRAARALHAGGVNYLLGDGSVNSASPQIDRALWRRLGTRTL